MGFSSADYDHPCAVAPFFLSSYGTFAVCLLIDPSSSFSLITLYISLESRANSRRVDSLSKAFVTATSGARGDRAGKSDLPIAAFNWHGLPLFLWRMASANRYGLQSANHWHCPLYTCSFFGCCTCHLALLTHDMYGCTIDFWLLYLYTFIVLYDSLVGGWLLLVAWPYTLHLCLCQQWHYHCPSYLFPFCGGSIWVLAYSCGFCCGSFRRLAVTTDFLCVLQLLYHG